VRCTIIFPLAQHRDLAAKRRSSRERKWCPPRGCGMSLATASHGPTRLLTNEHLKNWKRQWVQRSRQSSLEICLQLEWYWYMRSNTRFCCASALRYLTWIVPWSEGQANRWTSLPSAKPKRVDVGTTRACFRSLPFPSTAIYLIHSSCGGE